MYFFSVLRNKKRSLALTTVHLLPFNLRLSTSLPFDEFSCAFVMIARHQEQAYIAVMYE